MRHHIRGPSKKLAPAIDSETTCPHTFNDEDGYELEVDCQACPGASDIGNKRCASGVTNILVTGAHPEAIVLKRYIHKRFRGGQVEALRAAAEELCALNRAISAAVPPSDKECRTCQASARRSISFLRARLLDDPLGYVPGSALLHDELRSKASATTCTRAHACIEDTLSVSTLHVPEGGDRRG
jgi:hypothetical protein